MIPARQTNPARCRHAPPQIVSLNGRKLPNAEFHRMSDCDGHDAYGLRMRTMPANHLDPDQLRDHQPLTIDELSHLLAGAPVRWGLCGGLAIDLFVGHPTRQHADLDISIFREDEVSMRTWMASWEFWGAHEPGKGLDRLSSSQPIPADVHAIWCRESGSESWSLEMLVEEGDSRTWRYRRDSRIRRPVSEVFWKVDKLPVMRPEIILLYKSKQPRENDMHDFDAALPKLGLAAREWLRSSLVAAHPTSPWAALV